MWDDIIAQKDKWIGGMLYDEDRDIVVDETTCTKLVDICYAGIANGHPRDEDWIEFVGEKFSCGAVRSIIGISCEPMEPGELIFAGAYGMRWRIVKP